VGDAAVLVDPYDPAALADGMFRVLSDASLQADLRRRGLERARRFSWEESARRVRGIYEAIGRRQEGAAR
jgi:glycosyltransferase involved in cell wall biosynthesis